MHDIARLIEDHDAVDALADRLIVSARPGQASADACRTLMSELASVLERLLTVDWTVGLPFPDQIAALKAELAELSDHWDSYEAEWNPAQIDAQRSRYSGATTDLMTVLKLQLVRDLGAPMMLARVG